MSRSFIKRPSLGQIADLGDFYDASTDSFSSLCLLRGPPPPSTVRRIDNPSTEMEFLKEDTYEEKFRKFGIEAELGASILSGLMSVGGTWRFLMDTRSSSLTQQISCLYRLTTVHEKLNLGAFHTPELQELLNFDALRGNPGTHVVCEIEWGASSAVTARCNIEDSNDTKEIQAKLGAGLDELNKIVGVGATANAGFQFERGKGATQTKVGIKVCGDLITDEPMPTDFEGAENYIKSMPASIAAVNDGKGKPLAYTLLPIEFIRMIYNLDIQLDTTLNRLNHEALEQFVQLFDDWAQAYQTLEDYHAVSTNHEFCLPSDHLEEVRNRLRHVKVRVARLREEYAGALADIRRGTSDSRQLWELLGESQSQKPSPADLASIAAEHRETIKFAALILSKGGCYIGRNAARELDTLIMGNGNNDTYVLYFNDTVQSTEAWQENRRLLTGLLETKAVNDQVIVYDCDLGARPISAPYVEQYCSGRLITSNLVAARRFLEDRCVIRFSPGVLDPSMYSPPVQRRKLKLRCPRMSCPSTKHIWICERCKQSVEFGYVDNFLYCRCGRFPYTECRFRCKEHDDAGPTKPDTSILLEWLQDLQPLSTQEINVLILGEAGVGKSTWINAFVNYLTYQSLEEAMEAEEPKYVVPYAFSYQLTDEKGQFESYDIQCGSSPDEKNSTSGESSTQRTVVHRIPLDDEKVLRLVDTPGIGDTRGIEQDALNKEDILATLQHISKLHGILILLKPTNARLTVMFRFCITELLTHLHRDAVNNICFGFTNTRGSGYSPGDTFNPLQTLLAKYRDAEISLSDHNTYCFDSESFRFLAALSQTKKQMPGLEDYKRSWLQSARESQRLLAHWSSLDGHKVKGTLSVNTVRDHIIAISEPLATLMKNIAATIQRNEERARELRKSELTGEELKAKLYIEVIKFENVNLPKTRLVCSDTCRTSMMDSKGQPHLVYKSICHDGCRTLSRGQTGEMLLRACRVFDHGLRRTCKLCGHDWNRHLQVKNELRLTKEERINPEVQQEIDKNASDARLQAGALASIERDIKKREAEKSILLNASVEFGQYLKHNSIVPYNDERLPYIEAQLKAAENPAGDAIVNLSLGTCIDAIDSQAMRGLLDTVAEEELAIIKSLPIREANSDEPTETVPTEDRVDELLRELYDMDGLGPELKDFVSRKLDAQKPYTERSFHGHLDWQARFLASGREGSKMPDIFDPDSEASEIIALASTLASRVGMLAERNEPALSCPVAVMEVRYVDKVVEKVVEKVMVEKVVEKVIVEKVVGKEIVPWPPSPPPVRNRGSWSRRVKIAAKALAKEVADV